MKNTGEKSGVEYSPAGVLDPSIQGQQSRPAKTQTQNIVEAPKIRKTRDQREKINNLHRQFKKYGQNALLWKRKCANMLLEIDREEVWKKKGFSSIFMYAKMLAGLSENTVREALRIRGKIEEMPEIVRVSEKMGINRIKPIATIVTKETAEFWAEKAQSMSKNDLQLYVNEYRKSESHTGMNLITGSGNTEKLTLILLSSEIEDLKKLKGNKSWSELMQDLIKLKKSQVTEEKQKIADQRAKLEVEKPKPVNSRSHYIPAKIDKYIEKRAALQTRAKILDGARIPAGTATTAKTKPLLFCEEPGCCKPYDEKHHTKRFAQHHIHDPDQIYLICQEHHNLMHLGLIAHEELGPQYWKVRTQNHREEEQTLYQQTGDPALMTNREHIDKQFQRRRQLALQL
jgi:predicted CopG family antitoxin